MNYLVLYGFIATVITWLVTAFGAATVVLFKNPKQNTLDLLLGFSAGVMIAASFWSLLNPAIESAKSVSKIPPYFVATLGFSLGVIFMIIIEKTANKLNFTANKSNNILMLIISITLHNIPEGLAVGVAFGSIGKNNGQTLIGAITIALGIAIQNFPEGAAVSLPLRREGYSRFKSFLIGQATALVEPISGLIGAVLVLKVKVILPYALSFAAGAMILVATHEIIPECQKKRIKGKFTASYGICTGFAVMMLLDVMLG